MRLSSRTEGYLKEAGWSGGRQIDTAPYRRFLTERGFFYNERVDALYRNLGGLTISYVTVWGGADVIRFNILDPPNNIGKDDVEPDEALLGEELCFVGDCSDALAFIEMGADGAL